MQMTLIVAGYSGQEFVGRACYDDTFIVGDTLLSQYNERTQKRDRLIDTYKKIRAIPVRVWSPSFDSEGYFTDYHETFKSTCGIAFAGSALTFNHMLNGIQEHLGKLRYTFAHRTYQLVKHCAPTAIRHNSAEIWAEDIVFKGQNLPKLTASFQMEVISHVITRALKDVSGHRLLDRSTFASIQCEMAISLFCWEKRIHELYHVQLDLDMSELPCKAVHSIRKLDHGEIVVLGQTRLQAEAESAMKEASVEVKAVERVLAPRSRGREPVRGAKEFIRKHILEDIASDSNYIGGYLDCWEFSEYGFEQWYEPVQVDQAPPLSDE
jgi:hypothetical protein